MYVPELALVRFVIEDHDSTSDNEFVGQYTLPFNSLKMGESVGRRPRGGTTAALSSHFIKGLWGNTERPVLAPHKAFLVFTHFSTVLRSHAGYRHVPLLDKNGNLLPSAGLFVHAMILDAN